MLQRSRSGAQAQPCDVDAELRPDAVATGAGGGPRGGNWTRWRRSLREAAAMVRGDGAVAQALPELVGEALRRRRVFTNTSVV